MKEEHTNLTSSIFPNSLLFPWFSIPTRHFLTKWKSPESKWLFHMITQVQSQCSVQSMTKKFLIDDYYKPIYESVRSECSSCRVEICLMRISPCLTPSCLLYISSVWNYLHVSVLKILSQIFTVQDFSKQVIYFTCIKLSANVEQTSKGSR